VTPVTPTVTPSWSGLRKATSSHAPDAHRVVRERWLLIALLYTPILSSTFLSKIAVPPFGQMGLGIDIPLTLGVAFIGMLLGRFAFHTGRLMLYLLMISVVGTVHLARGELFSTSSMLFLIGLYAPYVLRLGETSPPQPDVQAEGALRVFAKLATFFAACGVLQYFTQFVLGAAFAFPMEHWLPEGFLIENFNYLNPLNYGSRIYKANGIFFLEPSFFSQFTALGLLLELSLWNRRSRIALYIAALAVTYSGTGIIVAAIGLAVLVLIKQRWDLLVFGMVIAVLAVLFTEPLNLNLFAGRASEFESTRSSGFERFVAWTYMFEQHWWPDNSRVLFGAGAGSFVSFANVSRYNAAGMAFSKMLFEFGVVGAVLYFGFLIYAIHSMKAPAAFKFGLTASLFLNGAYSAFASGILLSALLWPTTGRRPETEPAAPSLLPRKANP
jgi:hypothetical protein